MDIKTKHDVTDPSDIDDVESLSEDDILETDGQLALAAAPADPDTLARRLGIRGPAFATVIARLLIRGQIVAAAVRAKPAFAPLAAASASSSARMFSTRSGLNRRSIAPRRLTRVPSPTGCANAPSMPNER